MAWVILAAAIALIALPLRHVPVRLVLNLLPFALLFVTVWWLLRRLVARRTETVVLACLAAICVLPAYGDNRRIAAAQRGRNESPVLWSITLHHPDQAILRYIPISDMARQRPQPQRLIVHLALPYSGPAALEATVNGTALGRLRPLPADGEVGQPESSEDWGLIVPAEVIARRPVAEVEIRQSAPDPKLRIMALAELVSAAFGANAVWFYDGQRWHQGIVQPATGRIVPGLPYVELQVIP